MAHNPLRKIGPPLVSWKVSPKIHRNRGWCCLLDNFRNDLPLFLLLKEEQYQPSGGGGTRSPPATPYHLQSPKWLPGGPKMADRVW